MILENEPRVRHLYNPLNMDKAQAVIVQPGATIRSLAPNTPLPFICVRNGTPILRRFWDTPVVQGDDIAFHILPEGGGGKSPLRILLTIALVVAVVVFQPQLIVAFGTFGPSLALLAGSILINMVAPIKGPLASTGADFGAPSSTYDAALAGNAARLDSPIPVMYGRHLRYPDFAAQPYVEYVGNDQYYTGLFCIGMGDYSVERIMIDDTKIENFNDVTTPVIVHPSQPLPSWLDPGCFNASEVSGQEMVAGKPLGPFMVTDPAGPIPDEIWFDFVMPNGLFQADPGSGNLSAWTIRFQIDMRAVNSFGNPIESWYGLTTITITEATRDTIRKTYKIPVNAGSVTPYEPVAHNQAHFEVRVTRITAKLDNAYISDTINWSSMRAFTSDAVPLEPRATYLAIRVRSSEQLAGLSQRKIAVIATRVLPIWDQSSRDFTSNAPTRSIEHILADILVNTSYGGGVPVRRVDMETLTELGTVWAGRQDWCDIVFDSKTTLWDALRTVARCGRAVPLVRGGQFTFVRDGQQDFPVAMFSDRTIIKNSLSIEYLLPNEASADAVDLEYFDHNSWDFQRVRELAPGVTTPVNPTVVRLLGITGPSQARREAAFIIADSFYRRRVTSWQSEYDGFIPSYGSLVAVSHDLPSWGQTGDVTDWVSGTRTLELSEPATFASSGTHYIIFQRDDGSVTEQVTCTQTSDPRKVILSSTPDITFSFTDPGRESTKYIFGSGDYRVYCKVISLTPSDVSQVQLSAVVEDDRVHLADNEFLPLPGVIQDPVIDTALPPDGEEPDPGSGTLVGYADIAVTGYIADNYSSGFLGHLLKNDGSVRFYIPYPFTINYKDFGETRVDWYSFYPATPTFTGQFEARATVLYITFTSSIPDPPSTPDAFPIGTFGTWLNLGTDTAWGFNVTNPMLDDSGVVEMAYLLEIRSTAPYGNVMQVSRVITLTGVAHRSGGD